MTKKWIKLRGITKTPIVSKRTRFFHKIGVVNITGRPRVFGKLTKGKRNPPMTFPRGMVPLSFSFLLINSMMVYQSRHSENSQTREWEK